jgi:hypothetical protein
MPEGFGGGERLGDVFREARALQSCSAERQWKSEMSRISRNALLRAIQAVQEMNNEQKLGLADEIFSSQPNMLASVLVLPQLGVSTAKQEFVLEILFLCFQAMKVSGLTWPLITEDEQENQLRRHNILLRFYASLDGESLRNSSVQQFVDGHSEQDLLAWVMTKCREWRMESVREESDKYVLQVAVNLVNCIAFVPMPATCS